MIFDPEAWREIGTTLAQNKSRTFLTAFGVFWGTAMLALLIGGSKGFKSFMMLKFDGFATNTAIIQPNRTTISYKGFNKGMEIEMRDHDVEMIKAASPQIDHLSSITSQSATAKYSKKAQAVNLIGVESDYNNLFVPVLYSGRLLNPQDDQNASKVCLVGKDVGATLFGVGNPIGEKISIDDIYYKVVGVVGQTSDISVTGNLNQSVVLPYNTFRRAYNMGDKVDFVLFSVASPASPKDIENTIRSVMSKNHPISPDDNEAVIFFDISENFKMVDNLFMGITLLALFVGIGTLLSGIIGVGNIMWIVVRERTKEIGIRRALGARPVQIISQILSEGIVLTLVAGVAGICFAALILGVTEMILPGIKFQMSFANAMEIMAAFVILGSLAGIVPAMRAMKIKPIEALNKK